MNKDILEGNWTLLKGKVKTQWGKLTDDDITKVNGNYEQLQGLLQKNYGYQKEEADTEIKTFLDKCNIKEKSNL
jgi:uncharacterized protein YjbJ (UPF0337 family)